MKKTFTKVSKSMAKLRSQQLAGAHYTNERIETTNGHVAIIEKLKEPLKDEFDILIGLDSVPRRIDYPDLDRIVPAINTNSFVIDLPMWEAVSKAYKREKYLKLESDGTIKGQRVGTFEKLDEFQFVAFDPQYTIMLAEYAKESGQKQHVTIDLNNSDVKPAVVRFEQQDTNNIFVITPIRMV